MLMTTKNGRTAARIVALAIAVVMLVAFATGCSDKAMARADEAYSAADAAQNAADSANQAAKDAQSAADNAMDKAEEAANLAAGKVTSEEVTAAIESILKAHQDDGTIVTKEVLAAELEKLLTGAQLSEQIKAVEEKFTAAIAKHAEDSDAALAELLKNYLTSDKINELVTEAANAAKAGAIEEAQGLVNELSESVVESLTNLSESLTESQQTIMESLAEEINNLHETITEEMNEKLGELKEDIEEILDQILPGYLNKEEYKSLNELVCEAYLEICAQQADFAAENAGRYSAEGFAKANTVFEISKVMLLRAIDTSDLDDLGVTTDDNGDVTVVIPGIVAIPTILDELFVALGEVPETILLYIEGATDNNNSEEAIDACIDLLAQATGFSADEIANYEYIDDNGELATIDLGAVVEELENYYINLLASYVYANNGDYVAVGAGAAYDSALTYYEYVDGKFVVANVDASNFNASELFVCTRVAVNDLINALANPKWDTYKKETRDELKAKFDAMSVAVNAWLDKFYTETEARSDVNINRILPNYVTYRDATSKYLAELYGVEELVAGYVAEIDKLLGTDTTWYKNETVLYTATEALTALLDRINADDTKYGSVISLINAAAVSAEDATAGNRFDELNAARAYAVEARQKNSDFVNGDALANKFAALAKTVNAVTVRDAELYDAAVAQYNKWIVLRSGANLDAANVKAIIESHKISTADLKAVGERMEVLKNAKVAVADINTEIAKYYTITDGAKVYIGSYYDMTAIEAIAEAADEWLETYGIEVAVEDSAAYINDNYNLLDHAGLAFILKACDDKIDEVLKDAEAFRDLVVILATDLDALNNIDYPLYYYDLYNKAVAEYTRWVIAHGIKNIQDPNFNFGSHEDEGTRIQELYAYMIKVGTPVTNAYTAAKADFDAAASVYKTFTEKFTASYVPSVEDKWVVDAYNTAKAWTDKYLNMTDEAAKSYYFGSVETSNSIDAAGLLTEEFYEQILVAKAAYDAKVTEAVNALIAVIGNRTNTTVDLADFCKNFATIGADGYTTSEFKDDLYTYTFSVTTDVVNINVVAASVHNWVKTYLGDATYDVADTTGVVNADLKSLADYAIATIKGLTLEFKTRQADFNANWTAMADKVASINNITIDLYSLVEGENFITLYNVYKAYANLYLAGDNTSAALTFDVNDADALATFKANVDKLNAAKVEAEKIAAAKHAEREAIVALIAQLGFVNTTDDAALTLINTKYEAWAEEIVAAKEAKGENGYVYVIPTFNGTLDTTDEIDNYKTLVEANAKMASIKAAITAAKTAIATLGDAEIGKTVAEIEANVRAKFNAAIAALETYHALQGILADGAYDKTVFAAVAALDDTLKITTAEYKIVTDAQAVLAAAESIAAVYAIFYEFEQSYADEVDNFIEARTGEINLIVAQVSGKLAADDFDAAEYLAEVSERFESELQSIVDNSGAIAKPEVDNDDTGSFDDSWKIKDLI